MLTKAIKRRKMGARKFYLPECSLRKVDSLKQEEKCEAKESEKAARRAYDLRSDLPDEEDSLHSHTVGRADKTWGSNASFQAAERSYQIIHMN
jgi:hypothetical protein